MKLYRNHAARRGVALVLVLAVLVILLSLVIAYFSRASLHRKIGSVSASATKASLLAQTATDFILDDVLHEIEAGSEPDAFAPPAGEKSTRILRPRTVAIPDTSLRTAPSMVPQRTPGSPGNLLKVSRGQQNFFSTGPGYAAVSGRGASGAARASSIPTSTPSQNGRFVARERWSLPALLTDSEFANNFVEPDWIYLTRSGTNPTTFDAASLATFRRADLDNPLHVIGRFAYAIYDVGGLIDANVVGNSLAAGENGSRGLLHQVSLADGIGGVALPDFQEFVEWRSAASGNNASSEPGSGGLFDPRRNVFSWVSGDQGFVNRQDLIRYTEKENSPLPRAALPYLTTFNVDVNAPIHAPDPNRAKLPASPPADEMNPDILAIRFPESFTLTRPGETPIQVPAGSPVMLRRFPLSKLALLQEPNPDPDELLYYFGLEKIDDHTWRYVRTVGGRRIARLGEVAELRREPNFFEVLQAAMYTGSLGKAVQDANNFQRDRDRLHHLQIMQIGANVIDQADEDDLPTTIQHPSGRNADPFDEVYGIENLPYISQIGVVGWRPTDDRDTFQAWAIFDVWNPHQNAANPPTGIAEFRVRPVERPGSPTSTLLRMMYRNVIADDRPTAPAHGAAANRIYTTTARFEEDTGSVVGLNSGRNFTFSAGGIYAEPTTIGTPPNSRSDTPGILLAEVQPGMAIPPPGPLRRADLQADVAIIESAFGQSFGVKAHNAFRFVESSGTGWNFELQARFEGETQWRTYQRIERFLSAFLGDNNQLNVLQSDIVNSPVTNEPWQDIATHTHHSAGGALENEFYTWRSRGASTGYIKPDPRTNRFGFSGWGQTQGIINSSGEIIYTLPGNDFFGRSVRSSAGSLPNSILNDTSSTTSGNSRDWAFPGGLRRIAMRDRNSSSDPSNSKLRLDPTFEILPQFQIPTQRNALSIGLYGLVSNNPNALNAAHPLRYSDNDGVVRPADGVFGGLPTVPSRFADRPVILNRPFRSVGELGYAFRDIPWKTLDFFTRRSGDLGLMDFFSVSEAEGSLPLAGGRVNLNTARAPVLASILRGSSKQLPGINPAVSSSEISQQDAQAIVERIVEELSQRPIFTASELVSRVFDRDPSLPPATNPVAGDTRKIPRETAIRSLSEMGTTRTWNFLIDLIAQPGRFSERAQTAGDFIVQGEVRQWIHVSIDRITGQVLSIQKEVVYE